MDHEETLGERVRAYRKLRGLTQAELAAKARMERTDIIAVEKDRLPLGTDRLHRVADALEVSVLELQPEAEPDERGLDLLVRLGELADGIANLEESHVQVHRKLDELLNALLDGFRRTGDGPTGTGR